MINRWYWVCIARNIRKTIFTNIIDIIAYMDFSIYRKYAIFINSSSLQQHNTYLIEITIVHDFLYIHMSYIFIFFYILFKTISNNSSNYVADKEQRT